MDRKFCLLFCYWTLALFCCALPLTLWAENGILMESGVVHYDRSRGLCEYVPLSPDQPHYTTMDSAYWGENLNYLADRGTFAYAQFQLQTHDTLEIMGITGVMLTCRMMYSTPDQEYTTTWRTMCSDVNGMLDGSEALERFTASITDRYAPSISWGGIMYRDMWYEVVRLNFTTEPTIHLLQLAPDITCDDGINPLYLATYTVRFWGYMGEGTQTRGDTIWVDMSWFTDCQFVWGQPDDWDGLPNYPGITSLDPNPLDPHQYSLDLAELSVPEGSYDIMVQSGAGQTTNRLIATNQSLSERNAGVFTITISESERVQSPRIVIRNVDDPEACEDVVAIFDVSWGEQEWAQEPPQIIQIPGGE